MLSLCRGRERVLAEERILGQGEFVDNLIGETDERLSRQCGHNRPW